MKIKLSLPPADSTELWEVDLDDSSFYSYLGGWLDEALKTKKEAVRYLISVLLPFRQRLPRILNFILFRALSAQPPPWLIRHDEMGDTVAIVTPELVQAFKKDYVTSNTYLQEPECKILSTGMKVDVEIFDLPDASRNIIRSIVRYGTGKTHQGYLLFSGGNHYSALTPAVGPPFAFQTEDEKRRMFNYSHIKTVVDGNCLIDGMYIIQHGINASPEFMKKARRYIGRHMRPEHIRIMLEGIITSFAHGEQQQGVGPLTLGLLRQDALLLEKFAQSRAKQRKKTKKSVGYKPITLQKPFQTSGPVIGVEGIDYIGPRRTVSDLSGKSDIVYHGESEIEFINIKKKLTACIRIYCTVAALEKIVIEKDHSEGYGESPYKDIQQITGGKIIISEATPETVIYMSAGRPLRMIKWVYRYKEKGKIRAKQKQLEIDSAKQKVQTPQDYLPDEVIKAKKILWSVKARANPLIRSFLLPLEVYNEIAQETIVQSQVSSYKTTTENSDQSAAPNQYGIKGTALVRMREYAVPNTLVTYAVNPKLLMQMMQKQYPSNPHGFNNGEVLPVDHLKMRLGVPLHDINEEIWVSRGSHQSHEKAGGIAKMLSFYYGAWLRMTNLSKKPNPFYVWPQRGEPPEDAKQKKFITWLWDKLKEQGEAKEIKLDLDNFIKSGEAVKWLTTKEVTSFMKDVVAPWATQAEISRVIAEDYEILKKDPTLQPTYTKGRNAFFAMRLQNKKK